MLDVIIKEERKGVGRKSRVGFCLKKGMIKRNRR